MAASLSDKVSKASQNQKRKTKKTTPFASSRRDTSQSFLQSKDGDILNVDRHRVVDHQSCGSNYTSKESFRVRWVSNRGGRRRREDVKQRPKTFGRIRLCIRRWRAPDNRRFRQRGYRHGKYNLQVRAVRVSSARESVHTRALRDETRKRRRFDETPRRFRERPKTPKK